MKALILFALLLTSCGSGPNDTGIRSKLDDDLKIAVKDCGYHLKIGSTPMSHTGYSRSVPDVAKEICDQVRAGKRTMRDGWGF